MRSSAPSASASGGGATEAVKPVTRSRTQLYLQFRNDYRSRGGRPGGVRRTYDDDVDSPASAGIALGALGGAAPEPPWVQLSRTVEDKMAAIEAKLKKLREFMKSATMLDFNEDMDSKNDRIEMTATEISALFHECQKIIKSIKTEADVAPEENKTRHNAQMALATRLQALSQDFRKAQTAYLSRLQGTEDRVKAINTGVFGADDPQGKSGLDDDGLVDHGFTDTQLQELENNLAIVDEREREIAKIAKSINEIAMLFRDMQQMIIDQGTILDQIEHNIDMVVEHTGQAKKEIDIADKYQKSYRNKLCILLLIIIVVALIIAVSFKPR